MKSLFNRLKGHFREYVARYSVLALAVLTPAAALLGELAANLGGADTPAGRAVLGAAAAIGTAAAGIVFIRNLGIWQMLDEFGTAPGALPKVTTQIVKPVGSEVEPILPYGTETPGEVPLDLDDSVHEITDGLPDEPVSPDPEVEGV